jgi:outer membrane usher protein
MIGSNLRRKLGRSTSAILIVLLLCGAAQPNTPTEGQAGLASHFRTAPEAISPQVQLVQIFVNGVDAGFHQIIVAAGSISLPAATIAALRIASVSGDTLVLTGRADIASQFDEAKSVLNLTVPISMLGPSQLNLLPGGELTLSPETWGTYVNYDMNMRRAFGGPTTGPGAGLRWGGLFDLNGLGPDLIGHNSWAYDSGRSSGQRSVRLDTNLTWRPASLDLATTAGDLISDVPLSLPAARPYRFGGVEIGTDHSGSPSWTGLPVPSVSGTAQAQSSIDVYINGQRQFQTRTSGGPFSLVLPPGAAGSPTSIVVTDVTGRNIVLPLQVQPVDVRLLREGTFLWSVGAGAPRFSYGSLSWDYLLQPYGFANARYGVTDGLAVSLHSEGGRRLAELEAGADFAATSWLSTHSSIAGSRSDRGNGSFASAGLSIRAPWQLSFDSMISRSIGPFDDVVSASGRSYDIKHGISPLSTLPPKSSISGRITWQPTPAFSLTSSYQQTSYIGSPRIGLASLSASYRIGDVPTFVTLSRTTGRQNSMAVIFGVSFTFGGDIQTTATGGYETGTGPGSRISGGFSAAKPLREEVGDIGWQATAQRQPSGIYADAAAEVRTGYGIPGVEVNSFAGQTTGYVKARGSLGFVEWHPFVGDPVTGGLVLADGGAPGMPIQLNGYDKGKTSFDGKLLIPDAIPGAQQRVAIDTSRLPLNLIPSDTDKSVVVRRGGATVAGFGAQSADTSAIVLVTVDGKPPPIGSNLVAATSSAPIDRKGQAYLPSLARDEVLTVEFADGGSCKVHTTFDGQGGVTRKIGPFACVEARR